MNLPLVCLTVAAPTLEENAALVQKYNRYIDIAELRVDFLTPDEQLYVRRFPAMVNVPCILAIRRKIDGGLFESGEISRTMLFGRALAFADQNPQKNFAYVDFEDDYHIPSLQDAALAFGVRIIRSCYDIERPIKNLKARCDEMRKTGYEIPKIVFMPKTLADVTHMFQEATDIKGYEHILCALGPLGQVTRILAHKLNSYLTYVLPEETVARDVPVDYIDPIALDETYCFRAFNTNTALFALAGWPLPSTASAELHNTCYKAADVNVRVIPLRSPAINDILDFAEQLDIRGVIVDGVHKEAVVPELIKLVGDAEKYKLSDIIIRTDNGWVGYNTGKSAFQAALSQFMATKKLRHRRIAIIGADGDAKIVAAVVKEMGGKACIFNKTIATAKELADKYGFEYALLGPESARKFERYSDIIIQTLSKEITSRDLSSKDADSLYFYQFCGTEKVFDFSCDRKNTPLMKRAALAGCTVCNGTEMMRQQTAKQIEIFLRGEHDAE